MDRDIKNIPAFVFDREVFALIPIQLSLDQTRETPNAMIDMDNVIPGLQVGI